MKSIKKYKKYWKWLSLALFVAIFALSLYVYHWEFRKPVLDIYFISLNRGRAIFIRTPENKTILIGAGQNSEVIQEITKFVPFYRRNIDMIITPSAVPAQIGGLLEILKRYSVSEVLMPRLLATSTVLSQLLSEIHKQKIHIEEVERGDSVNFGGVKLDTFFPYADFKFNKTNLPELGMSVSCGSTTAYFLGNLSKTIQKDIYNNTNFKKDNKNISEFYNNASSSKVYSDLIKKINPEFIFSTKEKTTHFVSDGEGWKRD